ncbi:hypothetical protein, partial [Neglectibacter timonensis]
LPVATYMPPMCDLDKYSINDIMISRPSAKKMIPTSNWLQPNMRQNTIIIAKIDTRGFFLEFRNGLPFFTVIPFLLCLEFADIISITVLKGKGCGNVDKKSQ